MLNVNRKLLTTLDENELYLLMHIAKFIGKNNSAFPSRDRLMKDTGWKKDKYHKILNRLVSKGLIEKKQKPGKNGQFGSNTFKVKTKMIGVYVPASQLEESEPCPVFADTVPCPDLPTAVEPTAEKPDTKYCKDSLSIVKEEKYCKGGENPPKKSDQIPEGRNLKLQAMAAARAEAPNYYQQFLSAYGVEDNQPLSIAWSKLEPDEWPKIIQHLPGYIARTSAEGEPNPQNLRWRKSAMGYLKNYEWINNPNPKPKNKNQIPQTKHISQIPA